MNETKNAFNNLLIDHIHKDLLRKTLPETMKALRMRYESEKYDNMPPSPKGVTDWLQGLCSACELPYISSDILEWYASWYGRVTELEEDYFLEAYWNKAGKYLYQLMYN